MQCLALYTPDGWSYHFSNPTRTRNGYWTANVTPDFHNNKPQNCCPVDIISIDEVIKFHPPNAVTPITFIDAPARTFDTYLLALPEWEQQHFTHVHYYVNKP